MRPSIALMIAPIVLFIIVFPTFLTIPPYEGDKQVFHFKKPLMWKQFLVHLVVFSLLYIGILFLLNSQYMLVSY